MGSVHEKCNLFNKNKYFATLVIIIFIKKKTTQRNNFIDPHKKGTKFKKIISCKIFTICVCKLFLEHFYCISDCKFQKFIVSVATFGASSIFILQTIFKFIIK